MRYRRETPDGDYSFGQGDNTFLMNSAECVAQSIKTRLSLWQEQWFLDVDEGTPYKQSVLGKVNSDAYKLAVLFRITETPGVQSVLSFDANYDSNSRRVRFESTVETLYGNTTVTTEI